MSRARKLPSFQFYPSDWLSDFALRRCSASARGAWIDMLCLMWNSEKRGQLILNGVPIRENEIAKMVGVKPKSVRELESYGVLRKSRRRGIYFSRRMVRDERLRRNREVCGRIGGKLSASKGQANPQANPQAKRGSSSPTSSPTSSPNRTDTESDKNNTPASNGSGRKSKPSAQTTLMRVVKALGLSGHGYDRQRRGLRAQIDRLVTRRPDAIDDAIALAHEKARATNLDNVSAAWWAAMKRRYPDLEDAK
jgi:hypothetical protein